MKEGRKNEIAFMFLVHMILRQGVHLGPGIPRQIERTAKRIGVSYGEAREFAEIVLHSLYLHVIAMCRLYTPRRKVANAGGSDGLGDAGIRLIQALINAPMKGKKTKKAKKGTRARRKK
jgi:hypothetical protein